MNKTVSFRFQKLTLLLFVCTFFGCQHNTRQYMISFKGSSGSSVPNLVSFTLPEEKHEEGYHLEDSVGNKYPIQIDANNKGWVLLSNLTNGENQFRLVHGQTKSKSEKVALRQDDNKITFVLDDKPIFSYQKDGALPTPNIDSAFLRGGYIHPVFTPKQKIITDDYAANHLHHHGIWTAWTKTVFEGRKPDFWNMGDKTGKVDFVSLDTLFEGAVFSGFSSTHQYTDFTSGKAKDVLDESWEVRVFNTKGNIPYYLFDLTIRQNCSSSGPLFLPTYHYGGLGFRGRENWNGEENTDFLTSEGKDRSNGHATTANWCHIGGTVEGGIAGITIMGHPDNFRAPQPMRIHPTEPFFNWAPSQAGDWTIQPGEEYVARYRFVVYDGEPDPELLQNLWKDYAEPLEVVVSRP